RTSCARSYSARERRLVEGAEPVVPEPADIAVKEGAQVVHPVLEHRQPVDADSKREALPFVGIEPRHLDHPAVDHAAAEQLHPAVPRRIAAAAEHPLSVLDPEADVDL